jgi:hypothetical protein
LINARSLRKGDNRQEAAKDECPHGAII